MPERLLEQKSECEPKEERAEESEPRSSRLALLGPLFSDRLLGPLFPVRLFLHIARKDINLTMPSTRN